MSVWITRTQPGAGELASVLAAAGFTPLVAPVLEIVPLAQPEFTPSRGLPARYEVCAVMSTHAARFALLDPSLRALVADCRVCVAVGEATAEVLRAAGLSPLVPQPASSEGMLALPELLGLKAGAAVVQVAGVDGRNTVADELGQRQIAVVKVAVYRRQPVPSFQQDLASVDSIVASSGDGLLAISDVWFGCRRSAAVPVISPSARVDKMAREAGFTNTRVSQGAGAEAVLAQLRQLQAS